MIHLYLIGSSGRVPVCGAEGAPRGAPVTRFYFSDLCPACLAYQRRKSRAISKRLRRAREEDA